jgi:ParB family transcriptional regulator, chromosome partitioning protein
MSVAEIIHLLLEELVVFVNQSRQVFDEAELFNLSEDIKAKGQLQPGVAWFDAGRGKYVLICGERRYRAIKMAGLPTMAVTVIQGNLTLGEMLAINLSENLQRQNLSPLERARAFQRLAQLEELTSRQVAERMHVSDATVSRDLAILELPEVLQEQIGRGLLPASIAAELRRIDDPQAQRELADAIKAGRMNRDQLAEAVRSRVGKRASSPKGGRISHRLDGGVSVTLAKGGKILTKADVLLAVDHLRKVAKKLEQDGDPADFARAS